ncbi:MAG: HGGxSTG domain-containing protein [Pseudomonadota bacterium]
MAGYKYTKVADHVERITALIETPTYRREWQCAFALLVLNGWSAIKAFKRLGQGTWLDGASIRKAASRATKNARVCYVFSRLRDNFELSTRTAKYVRSGHNTGLRYHALLLRLSRSAATTKQMPRTSPYPRRKTEKQVCGAKTRTGKPCQMKPEPGKKRCRLHGGLSTGPKTVEGKARSALNGYRNQAA